MSGDSGPDWGGLRPHPRVEAAGPDFARVAEKERKDPVIASWVAALRCRGRETSRMPPVLEGIAAPGLDQARALLDRVYLFGFLHRTGAEGDWAAAAWRELEAAVDRPWRTDHFLDCAQAVHAFAIGFDWLNDAWTGPRQEVLAAAMRRHGLDLAREGYAGARPASMAWMDLRNNWNQVGNGAMIAGAAALAGREPVLAEEVVRGALRSLGPAMGTFGDAGEYAEGPGYWRFATQYAVVAAATMEAAWGCDGGLFAMADWPGLGTFPLHMTGPAHGELYDFSDTVHRRISAPHLFWLAHRFGRPSLARLQARWAHPHPLDVLWCDPGQWVNVDEPEPPDRLFTGAGLQVATFRSSWNHPRAVFAGFKAGICDGGHLHLDRGGFVFEANGVRWAVELGTEDYGLPGVWSTSGPRWDYYRLRAEGHNTLVVDPGGGPDQDHRPMTRMVHFRGGGDDPCAVADLTPAVARRGVASWRRGVRLPARRGLWVQDELEADQPVGLLWSMHTPAAIQVADGGGAALLSMDGECLEARILGPSKAGFEVLPAAPLPGSPSPPGQRANPGIRKLAIRLGPVRSARIMVWLCPCTDREKLQNPPADLPLGEWA